MTIKQRLPTYAEQQRCRFGLDVLQIECGILLADVQQPIDERQVAAGVGHAASQDAIDQHRAVVLVLLQFAAQAAQIPHEIVLVPWQEQALGNYLLASAHWDDIRDVCYDPHISELPLTASDTTRTSFSPRA